MKDKQQFIYDEITKLFPSASCELKYSNPLELLIAVMLSAQTTDLAVNHTTHTLFNKYHSLEDYLNVEISVLENDIRHLGLYKNKAKNIQAMVLMLKNEFDSQFPNKLEELVMLPGVGRKTANVFLAEWFHVPRIAVDTHVSRVSIRLGLAKKSDSVLVIEEKLMKHFPKDIWIDLHHKFIHFGRYFCKAQKPSCQECPFLHICKAPILR